MPENTCKLYTISPIQVAPLLRPGISDLSPGYQQLLTELKDHEPSLKMYRSDQGQQYKELANDDSDIRLFSLSIKTSIGPVQLHMYPASIAIAELMMEINIVDTTDLEEQAQEQTRLALDEVYPKLYQLLQNWAKESQSTLLNTKEIFTLPATVSPMWTARTLLLEKKELRQKAKQLLLTQWLKGTRTPEHAEEMIAGKCDHSLTWLNYAVIEPMVDDYRLQTMLLAQYYYAAQEIRNRALKVAIAEAYSTEQLKPVEEILSQNRIQARMLQINYHEHLKLLTRAKRKLLAEILDGWEFDSLIENSERMIEVCSSRLEENDNKRRERSTVLTDLILVTLSFFAVFELCLYLVEFSREMMSRPALDYNDESTSFFLSTIAKIDTDVMFVIGLALTLSLALTYKLIKDK